METSAHVSSDVVEEYEKEIEEVEDDSENETDDSFGDIKEIEYTSDSE